MQEYAKHIAQYRCFVLFLWSIWKKKYIFIYWNRNREIGQGFEECLRMYNQEL